MHPLIVENRQRILQLAKRHGARNVRVSGSMARGDAGAASDADFLVELEQGHDLFDLGELLMDLQDLLHCKVDIVTEPALHPRIRAQVVREAQAL
jgi:predicted nucleotidyltransferase